MIVAGILLVLVLVWYLLRAFALFSAPVRRLTGHLGVATHRLHGWVLTAPATFGYMAIFTASTLVQISAPPKLIDLLTTIQSTNLARLSTKPVSALIDSALWVADRGTGLAGYLLVFGTVVAWAERRYGTPRIVLIGLSGHVFGSLLTAMVETYAIRHGNAPRSLALSTDVGVSYIMVAGCAAAVLVMHGWFRLAAAAALAVAVVLPVLMHRTVWDLGHLLATVCGLAMALLTLLPHGSYRPIPVTTAAAPFQHRDLRSDRRQRHPDRDRHRDPGRR